MKDIFLIFRYNFKKQVSSTSYIVVTMLICAATILSLFMVKNSSSEDSKQMIQVFDTTNFFGSSLQDCNRFLSNSYMETVQNLPDKAYKDIVLETDTPVLVLSGSGDKLLLEFYDDNMISKNDLNAIVTFLQSINTQLKMEAYGISQETLQKLTNSVEYSIININEDNMDNYVITYVMYMLMGIAIIMYSATVAGEVTYIKTQKVMELLITSVSPNAILIGTTLAVGLSGLMQFVIILAVAALGLRGYGVSDILIQNLGISVSCLNLESVTIYILFFVLGFLLYALMSAGIGSLVNRNEDISVSVIPIQLLALVQFFIALFAISDGSNVAFKVLSFIPITSQTTMFVRYMMGYATIQEALLSLGILLCAVILVGYAASTLFRIGVMYYGDFNLKKILNKLK